FDLLSVPIPTPPPSPLFPYTTLFRSRLTSWRRPASAAASSPKPISRDDARSEAAADLSGSTVTPRPSSSPAGRGASRPPSRGKRSEEHTSELQSRFDLVCRLLLEKKN